MPRPLLAIVAATLALIVTACGPGATPTPAPTATPTPTPAPTATPSPTPTPPFPDFQLAAAPGGLVSLSGAIKENKVAVIVFYRGFF